MARRPLRPPFLLPCHTDRRFAASPPICSPLPYFPSLFSQPAASTFNTPSILAKHQYRHSTLTRPRTTTASTMRCMPGCPHLHVAAFIAARGTFLLARRTQSNSGELRLPSPPSSNTENGRVLAAISAFTRRTRAKSDCTNTLCSRDILKYPLYSCICSSAQPMARPKGMGCPQCMSACVKTRYAARRRHKRAQYIVPAALQTLPQEETRKFKHVQLAHKINI